MNTEVMIFAQDAAVQQTSQEQQVPVQTDAKPQGGFLSGLGGMLPMIIILVVMFYLMFRSQKKEQKRRQDMISSLKKGDSVITVGGIYGEIAEVKEDCFVLKVAENTEMSFSKNAIASVPSATGEVVKK